jgi:hypothetical protein
MNFKQVCLQIKLMWVGIGLLTIFCATHSTELVDALGVIKP